jgi:hypothetical protein
MYIESYIEQVIKYLSHHTFYTMGGFLKDWGRPLRHNVVLQHYKSLLKAQKEKLHSAYIFADLELIDSCETKAISNIWRQLEKHQIHLLNHPEKALKRLPLLNKLYLEGINNFNAYPVISGRNPSPERFPVFIREANDHAGPKTDLIYNQAELDECIRKLSVSGKLGVNPIVTEFTSVMGSDGRYYKYGAFCIGERIIPGHIHAGDHWMLKMATSAFDEELMAESLSYVESNPHEKELRKIFQIANIDYGRVDYGLCNGRIQVFEINTNPTILVPGKPKLLAHRQRKQYVAEQLIAAFRLLDARSYNPEILGKYCQL